MKIAFIHNHRAFLPEIPAYQDFFSSQHIETTVADYGEETSSGADIYWYLMGFFPKAFHKNKLIIHEYASASVPPCRRFKDFLKSRFNPRPHFRLFLNDYVRGQINIHDEIPFGYRDMGISKAFFRGADDPGRKEYDFIYSGSLSSGRKLKTLLRVFEHGALKQHAILLLGKDETNLAETFRSSKNIVFHPPVPWEQVPDFLSKAKFAINFVPDKEPFNAQTSTKFLEYAAMKIPVISTNYFWISEFQERWGGNYFLLKEDLSNLTWNRITGFQYAFPELESWSWEEKIKASGILEFLRQANRPGQPNVHH